MVFAVGFVVDVGPHMSIEALQAATECLITYTQQRFFTQSKELIALVTTAFGSANHEPVDVDGDFEHISIARPLGPYGWDLFEYLKSGFATNDFSEDLLAAVLVAADHIVKNPRNFSGKVDKRILVLSNFRGDVNPDRMDKVIKTLRRDCIHIDTVGLPSSFRIKQESCMQNQSNSGGSIFSELLNELNGQHFAFSEVIDSRAGCLFETLDTPYRPWKVLLSLGVGGLRIPLQGHHLVHQIRTPTLRPVPAGPDSDLEVVTVTSYHLIDEIQTEVPTEDTVSGYRYGATMVPFSKEDKDKIKVEGEKCLSLIGFTKSSNIRPNVFVGSTVMLFAADSPNVAKLDDSEDDSNRDPVCTAIAALVQALTELDSVALVRRVYSRASAPVLGVLIPRIDPSGVGLIYHDIAFREDIRTFTFPSLSVVEGNTETEEEVDVKSDLLPSRWKPNEEQIEAMEAFVDSMMLLDEDDTADKATSDEHNILGVAVSPKTVCNPWLHRFYTLVRERGLGNTKLPETNYLTNGWPTMDSTSLPGLNKLLTAVEGQLSGKGFELTPLGSALRELRRVMPEIAPAASTAAILLAKRPNEEADEAEVSRKRRRAMALDLFGIKVEPHENEGDHKSVESEKLADCKVGSIDPVMNFNGILRSGFISKACSELESHIYRLVDDPLTPELLRPKAIQCLRGYREAAFRDATLEVARAYNGLLLRWRADLESKPPDANRLAFWTQVLAIETSLGAICDEELEGLDLKREQAISVTKKPISQVKMESLDNRSAASQMAPSIDDLIDELE